MLSEPIPFFLRLLGYYVAITVPFLLAGIAIATPLTVYPAQVNRLYAADLFGAGVGCLAAVAALTWLDGPDAITAAAAVLLAGGALYAWPGRLAVGLAGLSIALAVATPFADRALQFQTTKSKALGWALAQPGTEVLFTRWSPVNRVDVYRLANPFFGFWGLFGISPKYRGPRPRAITLQYDGHNGSDIFEVRPGALRMLDHHLLRTPYLLQDRPRVLIIGVGGGIDILNAVRRNAIQVTGAELQPITLELHREMFNDWTGGMLQRPEVELLAAEGRHFVRSHDRTYDIIQMTATDTFSAQSTGAYVLAESYLYTIDAFEDYLSHLDDDGLVSVIMGDPFTQGGPGLTPLNARLALVARSALERIGVENPTNHILVAAHVPKGFMVGNLLVKRSPFTLEEIERVERFLTENGFELRFAPGGTGDPDLVTLLGSHPEEMQRRLDSHAFAVGPVSDDNPFFYHVLRWRSLLTGERTHHISPGSVTGLLVLLMMLVQAVLLGGALILFPLLRRGVGKLPRRQTAGFLLYFLGLGLGFMLIEISFVQKYVLLLGYPTYSLSVTIFSLLVSASLGAWLSRLGWARPRKFLVALLGMTIALVLIEILALPMIRDQWLGAPLFGRILVTGLLQLPLGLCLGMYFPTGIELLRRRQPHLIPWAWAVNGVGSVASTVLAVMLGMAIGFSGVAMVAAGTYLVGTLALLVTVGEDL
jgi:hypothetical protein